MFLVIFIYLFVFSMFVSFVVVLFNVLLMFLLIADVVVLFPVVGGADIE